MREDAFTSTQIGCDPLLVRKRERIMVIFDINWEAVQWSELYKPLYSALAAQLVLFNAQDSIPSDSDVVAQAHFWRENYNADGVVQDFVVRGYYNCACVDGRPTLKISIMPTADLLN